VDQAIQILGALLILVAFAANQRGRMDQTSATYLWLNLAGSVILAVLAGLGAQLGFLLLESCWAVVSAWGLIRPGTPRPRARSRRSAS
jgi:hypothetical protein